MLRKSTPNKNQKKRFVEVHTPHLR